ncbi:hypothetical protein BDF20DRAFT_826364 [Mycotypha africana]|uniref:uncharacterized protein n=1 Tax=Mycotypha africana TaxID=64632 RepID=UPI002301C343|nr:uncharacterized protein BDF20DRAFT_826364 [Mycotypha africana]KAI8970357.1 hypothetical protein BDF20DRAFT_826364 [Mycotypha africana]
MTFDISIPEAAATPDTIQFKLVIGGNDNVLPTFFRTFQQISWIYHKLKSTYSSGMVIPPLPDQPVLSEIDDQDYIERKRLQMERFFKKLARQELVENDDFMHFLSDKMSPTEVGPTSTNAILSFLRFKRVKGNRDDYRGFKSFHRPTEIIEGNDHDKFHKHQIYILLQESYYGCIHDSLNQLLQMKEELADNLIHMGDLIIETTQSKYRLGLGLRKDEASAKFTQRDLERKMQAIGLLMDDMAFINTRQAQETISKFGDVLIEYKWALDPLKTVFNARTEKLMEYAEQLKHRNRKRDRSDKLKLRLGMNHPEVRQAIVEEREVRHQ